ncbi:ABC transporter permease [Ornithinimicrobium sp. Y1847]|uniref:ABC transporter permease n=1 Tax=unclassified Ornithinimicrobium TaxID=2615080 RepID=UPI003B67BE52
MPNLWTTTRPSHLRIIAAAARGAMADLRTIYTPFTWTVGWLGRIIMQVIFFALIGTLLGSREAVIYLFIGQAVMATVTEVFMAIPSTTWERRAGTLALLTAAPAPLWPVFVGRSLQWLPSGVATGSIVLLAVGPFFGLRWSVGAALLVVPLLAVAAITMYAVSLTLAAVVLRGPRWRNVVSNVAILVTMLLSGATVPVDLWPGWLQAVGQILPVTHVLEAIRFVEAEGASLAVLPLGGLALMLGLAWYVFAALAFTHFSEAGRRTGTIDFAE